MKLSRYSGFKFGLVLGIGALIALVLCVQCVRTYLYTDAVLVPQQAEREAERQTGALTAAARSAGITDARSLGPVLEHDLESAADHLQWLRVLDMNGNLLAQVGTPQGTAKIPAHWWESVEKHESLGTLVDTPHGETYVAMLPLRIQPPPRFTETGSGQPDLNGHASGDRRPGYVLELAIPLKAVSGAFGGLRQNLIVGLIASIALLMSVVVIGLRTPQYLRGRYLEREMQLARRVQSDLQPKPQSVSSHVQFAASAIAADHVGGDFYDIFEAESGRTAIVLGDVSGKGVSAALLVSVLQGAIRSSTAAQHERACERINRMLCERTACERFATLFWGVFDPATSTLRYVNAGHAAPMLVQYGGTRTQITRLDEGGPVLGLLPRAGYSAGTVWIEASDMLILYSDGLNEATNRDAEEFGEGRILEFAADSTNATPSEVCERIMNQVTAFGSAGVPADDRTLLVVRFPRAGAVPTVRHSLERVEAVA